MVDQQTLREVRQKKKHQYDLRTRFRAVDGEPVYINQLVLERSPYLLQHAHNPVDWHNWSETTFKKAKAETKPVFLSIGYSTCHWCHVMEEESFDDEDVAALLNKHFIAIKLDREQRPDIDAIYMTAVQLITGRGGWPMSVFLNPEGQPFYGATYFQKPHFMRLLERIHGFWCNDRKALYEHAAQLTDAIAGHLAPPPQLAVIPDDLLVTASRQLMGMADDLHAGFGSAPKFPQEARLLFLLDQIARQPNALAEQSAWRVVKQTLDAMLQGGIYDHLAGGFHRYSTDRYWLVPHFEKMLYNQGQLVRVYNQAYRLSGDPEYRRIACETLDYVLREMRTKKGLFYSATDADSEGEEGKFFVWTLAELQGCLSDSELGLVRVVWGVKDRGNFEGANILFLPRPLSEAAKALGIDYPTLIEQLKSIKATLYSQRLRRTPPLTDTKIITEWNGMVIAAMAEASQIFGRPEYMQAAIQAVEQLWAVQRQPDGALWRISIEGTGSDPALLEDYAHLMEALLEIYDGTGQDVYLQRCQSLLQHLRDNFWDQSQGGFYISGGELSGPELVRSKSLSDSATICGNSQILNVLSRLSQRSGDIQMVTMARQHITAFAEPVSQQPVSALMFLRGMAETQASNPSYTQYFGHGEVKVRVDQATQANEYLTLRLHIGISDGWHVQGHRRSADCAGKVKDHGNDSNQDNDKRQDKDVSTHVRLHAEAGQTLSEVLYPPGQVGSAGTGQPAEVYSGNCKIMVRLLCRSAAPVRLVVRIQPCYETACLPLEEKEVVYWPANR